MTMLQGMNWIRKDKRLAIYLRDGLCCAYCGATMETGATLSLDHLVTRSAGGGNEETNLVTACNTCNTNRGDRDLVEFVGTVAAYFNHGVTAVMILNHIDICTGKDLSPFRKLAKEMASRPTWGDALRAANGGS